MEIQDILRQVKEGSLSLERAEQLLNMGNYEEMGYAKLDTSRKERTGFAEVVFCCGKADSHLVSIYERLYEKEGEVLGTRASAEQYELIKKKFPQIVYDPISRVLKLEKQGKERRGKVAVCTAGTADIPVAEEAAQTAEFFGTHVERVYDVGVSGIHRLLSRVDVIQKANCGGGGRHGGGPGQCYRGPGEPSGHSGPHLCGIWSEFPRPVSPSDHDQFLRQRHSGGKY